MLAGNNKTHGKSPRYLDELDGALTTCVTRPEFTKTISERNTKSNRHVEAFHEQGLRRKKRNKIQRTGEKRSTAGWPRQSIVRWFRDVF
jgi:hypothetical protein